VYIHCFYVCVYIYTSVYIHVYTYIYTYIYMCTYTCVYTYMYTCMYVHLPCIYTPNNTRIRSHFSTCTYSRVDSLQFIELFISLSQALLIRTDTFDMENLRLMSATPPHLLPPLPPPSLQTQTQHSTTRVILVLFRMRISSSSDILRSLPSASMNEKNVPCSF